MIRFVLLIIIIRIVLVRQLQVLVFYSIFASSNNSNSLYQRTIVGKSARSALLEWVRKQIPEYDIKNFTRDWNDGKAMYVYSLESRSRLDIYIHIAIS